MLVSLLLVTASHAALPPRYASNRRLAAMRAAAEARSTAQEVSGQVSGVSLGPVRSGPGCTGLREVRARLVADDGRELELRYDASVWLDGCAGPASYGVGPVAAGPLTAWLRCKKDTCAPVGGAWAFTPQASFEAALCEAAVEQAREWGQPTGGIPECAPSVPEPAGVFAPPAEAGEEATTPSE